MIAINAIVAGGDETFACVGTYDEEFHACSPGTLLRYDTMYLLARERFRSIDWCTYRISEEVDQPSRPHRDRHRPRRAGLSPSNACCSVPCRRPGGPASGSAAAWAACVPGAHLTRSESSPPLGGDDLELGRASFGPSRRRAVRHDVEHASSGQQTEGGRRRVRRRRPRPGRALHRPWWKALKATDSSTAGRTEAGAWWTTARAAAMAVRLLLGAGRDRDTGRRPG